MRNHETERVTRRGFASKPGFTRDRTPRMRSGVNTAVRDYRLSVPVVAPEEVIDLPVFLNANDSHSIELDIGFGKGRSLFERVLVDPNVRLLGIETKAKEVHQAEKRRAEMRLESLRVLYGDARDILRRCQPSGVIRRAYFNFPDPWWKKRHQKRLLISSSLLDELSRLLSPDGELFIQTDVEERAMTYRNILEQHPTFFVQGEGGFIEHNPFGARSNRQVRAEQDGLPIWRILATKREHHPAP